MIGRKQRRRRQSAPPGPACVSPVPAPALVATISSFMERTPSIRSPPVICPGNATRQPTHRFHMANEVSEALHVGVYDHLVLSLCPSCIAAGATDGGANGSAGSADNGADSFVPRGRRGTDMRARGCGHVAEYATSTPPSLAMEAGLTCERGDVYENTREGPAGADRLQTTSPRPSLCPHPNTCSCGHLAYGFYALAYGFYARAHCCRCGLSHRMAGSLTHAVCLRPSAFHRRSKSPSPSGLARPLPPLLPPHQSCATLQSSTSSAPRAHAHAHAPAPPPPSYSACSM
ncbi:hypothetical protein B0H13DRAFT_339889 [Mycena leptocephala]|nr:hypothetical protein B0H13DRAFT_339889 [Mycena leptocephala]